MKNNKQDIDHAHQDRHQNEGCQHEHEHVHVHSHPHSDEHGHGLEHNHDQEHEHDHEHVHSHPHDHSQGHDHSHDHSHAHPHSHGDGNHQHCGNCQNDEQKDIEILTLLLDHWASHNKEHAMEYNIWVEKMNKMGKHDVAEEIIEAIALMDEADKHLRQAKKNI